MSVYYLVYFTVVKVYGLTSHWTHNKSFQRRTFPGNRLHWYWQPNNNKEEIHKTQTTNPNTNKLALVKHRDALENTNQFTLRPRFNLSNSFYRASICEGGLGSRNSLCPSVRLSVRLSHAWIVTNLNGALQIFLYHTKGQSLCYSDTKRGWSATPPSLWNLRSNWPTSVRKTPTSTDFRS